MEYINNLSKENNKEISKMFNCNDRQQMNGGYHENCSCDYCKEAKEKHLSKTEGDKMTGNQHVNGGGCTCNTCLTASQQKAINDLYSSYSTRHNYTVGCQCGDCIKLVSDYLNIIHQEGSKLINIPLNNPTVIENFKIWFEGFFNGVQADKTHKEVYISPEQWDLLHEKIMSL